MTGGQRTEREARDSPLFFSLLQEVKSIVSPLSVMKIRTPKPSQRLQPIGAETGDIWICDCVTVDSVYNTTQSDKSDHTDVQIR